MFFLIIEKDVGKMLILYIKPEKTSCALLAFVLFLDTKENLK